MTTTKTYGPYRGYTLGMAIHPGEMLREELEAREMTQVALAKAMGRSPRLVNEIVRGRRSITAETALALEDALGISASIWMGQQSQYDLSVAMSRRERRLAVELHG